MSVQQTYQTMHDAPSETTLCPSETGLLPQNNQQQQQRQPRSKAIRNKAKKVLKGIADSYIQDAHVTSLASQPPVSCKDPKEGAGLTRAIVARSEAKRDRNPTYLDLRRSLEIGTGQSYGEPGRGHNCSFDDDRREGNTCEEQLRLQAIMM
jgi:hypothetical protein